jgi:hypothetical protein
MLQQNLQPIHIDRICINSNISIRLSHHHQLEFYQRRIINLQNEYEENFFIENNRQFPSLQTLSEQTLVIDSSNAGVYALTRRLHTSPILCIY